MKRVKKRPLFRFFREHRHVLFDEQTQKELLKAYGPPRGKAALPPAQMALAMLMQAAFGVPDHDVPELTACDSRWQMVLDCLGVDEPIMSQGSVFNFRMRAIHHGFDRLLIDRTVQLAKETKGYSAAKLRAALDSSPLVGAGRVEDTFNLIARAATHVVRAAAERLGKPVSEVAEMAGIPLVEASSVKPDFDTCCDVGPDFDTCCDVGAPIRRVGPKEIGQVAHADLVMRPGKPSTWTNVYLLTSRG